MNAYTLIIKFVFKQGDKSIFFATSQRFSEKVGFVFQLRKTWSRGLRASEATEQKWIAKMILKDLKAWFFWAGPCAWLQLCQSCRMLRLDVGKRERIKTYSNSSSSCSEGVWGMLMAG